MSASSTAPPALHRIVIGVGLVGQELQRHLARQPQIVGVVHDAHATRAELAGDAVVADGQAEHVLV